MPGRSQKKTLQEWEALLRETKLKELELAAVTHLRQQLEEWYTRAISTCSMRETLLKTKKNTTRQLHEVLGEGQQVAVQLRRQVREGN